MLRVILVDDEALARRGLRDLLAAHPALRIIGEAESAEAAAVLIRRDPPDALFLDINMAGADGFEMLGSLESPPKVVIVTAFAEHALRAFEVEAVDYLLKPVRPARLSEAVRRLEAACAGREDAAPYTKKDRICLRSLNRTLVARLSDVVALRADGDFARVYVSDEPASLLICHPLRYYEKTLPNPPFVRLDRSLMVNIDTVERIKRISRDEEHVWFQGVAEPFVLGRKASVELTKWLPDALLEGRRRPE
jgi:two-component system LytT family response regulator